MKSFTRLLILSGILGGYGLGELAPADACEGEYEQCIEDCADDHPSSKDRRAKCDKHCRHRRNKCVEARSHVYVEPEPHIVVEPYPPVVVEPWPWWHHHHHWR